MSTEGVEKQITEMAAPIADDFGLELVDVEYRQQGRQWLLCVYIDKEGALPLMIVPNLVASLVPCLMWKTLYRRRIVLRCLLPA